MKLRNYSHLSLPIRVTNLLGLFTFCMFSAGPALAQDTWAGGGADNLWNTGENWVDDSAPLASSLTTVLTFSGNTQTSMNNNITGIFTNSLAFTNDGLGTNTGAFILAGSEIGLAT